MKTTRHPGFAQPGGLRQLAAAAVLAAGGMASTGALAAVPGSADRAEINATWRSDRAACLDGSSAQDRRACLAEAAAVRKEALAGVLGLVELADEQLLPTEADLLANALARCDAVPEDARAPCERRVAGGEAVITVARDDAEGFYAADAEGQAEEPAARPEVIVAEAVEPPMEAPPLGMDEQTALQAEAAWGDEEAAEYLPESAPVATYEADDAPADIAFEPEPAPDQPSEPAPELPLRDVTESEPLPGNYAYPAWMRPARFSFD